MSVGEEKDCGAEKIEEIWLKTSKIWLKDINLEI